MWQTANKRQGHSWEGEGRGRATVAAATDGSNKEHKHEYFEWKKISFFAQQNLNYLVK